MTTRKNSYRRNRTPEEIRAYCRAIEPVCLRIHAGLGPMQDSVIAQAFEEDAENVTIDEQQEGSE